MINVEQFAARRSKLLDKIGPDSVAILFSASECVRNADVHFPFRQESNFYYYTGFEEPDSVALFLPKRAEGEFVLFNRRRDPEMEKWLGPRAGQEDACQRYGVDQAFDIEQIDQKIIALLQKRVALFYLLGRNNSWDERIRKWVTFLQKAARRDTPSLNQLSDLNPITASFRVVKDTFEIATLRKVTAISAAAHCKLMEACRPGLFEYELSALFDYEITVKGCKDLAYSTIVGGGANACILHYVQNKAQLKAGDLVLIDAGGEIDNYAADISRTFPTNGKFSKHQALLYQLVLDAQLAVIKEIKPGLPWNKLQEIAASHLTQGLIDLGILRGSLPELLATKAYLRYYMHNIGHWLGLDVHDAGAYSINGQPRPLEPGMVLTVEPGLYLSPNKELDQKWWHIGIRIEDDILVTENGCEVLTEGVPKTLKEIEVIMSRG